MSITYYLVQFSPLLLFIGITIGVGMLAAFAAFLFRKYVNIKILRSHNEVTGFLFLAIASLYSLLLGFVVLIVWDQLNETRNNVSKEGSTALSLYHDIKSYPDSTAIKPVLSAYLNFVFLVVDDEFPNMQLLKKSRKTPEAFNEVFVRMEQLNPQTPVQVQLVAEMFHNLNELASLRGLRTTAIETEIPPPIWLPIIFGAIITLLCSFFLDIEHQRLHITLIFLLGAFIGMFWFVIINLDHPFSGAYALKPQFYYELFTLEKWDHQN